MTASTCGRVPFGPVQNLRLFSTIERTLFKLESAISNEPCFHTSIMNPIKTTGWSSRLKCRIQRVAMMIGTASYLYAAPTEIRDWKSSSGTNIKAAAEAVSQGKVILRTADNRVLQVSLEKFSKDDISFLSEHFKIAAPGEIPPAPDLPAEDGLKWPLGQVSGPIEAQAGSTYYVYLPKQLPKGRKHPLLMVLNPHHGSAGTLQRYVAGAERNGWILITSVESANETDGKSVVPAVKHAMGNLPVDPARVYLGGFSGGSQRSFTLSKEVKAAGVLACGMGPCGAPLDRNLTIYAMAGTHCWNRENTAASLTVQGPKSKESFMRYFPGKHDWGNSELMEDGITHLNEVFLSNQRKAYGQEAYENEAAILRFAAELKKSSTGRALMWTSFLMERKVDSRLGPALAKLHAELQGDAPAQRYLAGMLAVNELAARKIGKDGIAGAKKDLEKLAVGYADTPWGEVCKQLQEPAEKSHH